MTVAGGVDGGVRRPQHGRPRPYVLAVRADARGEWRITRYIYRNHRDTQARLWREAGAQVRTWDVARLHDAALTPLTPA